MNCVCWLLCSALLVMSKGVFGKLDKREAELKQIGSYEVIDISFDSDNHVLSFVGFGQEYSLSADVNPNIVFSKMRHLVDGEDYEGREDGFLTSLSESCHYHVYKENNDGKFWGSFSACNKRGVRGMIKSGNDTLIFKPADYYLDLSSNHYDIVDKHIIYRMSDFDNTGYEEMLKKQGETGIKPLFAKDSNKNDIFSVKKVPQAANRDDGSGRKLLADTNYCEFLAIADPDYCDDFSGSDWYNDLVGDLADYVNGMSALFYQTSWGNSVGTIQVYFAGVLAVTSYSGDYASLSPSTSGGTVQSNDYLSKLKSWVDNNGIDFDSTQIFVGAYSFDTGGLAWVGTICYGGYSTGLTSIRNGDYVYPLDSVVHIATHELGHTFGCSHDQDTSCGNDGGLMGYGSNWDEFSSCSIAFVQELFEDQSTTCLRDGTRTFVDDPDQGGGGTDPTPKPTSKPTDDNGGGGDDCLVISGLYWSNLDGTYAYGGTYNGYSYYYITVSGTTYYLYYSSNWGGYHVYTSFADSNAMEWIPGTDPTSATYFYYYDNGWNYYTTVSISSSSDCDGGDGGNNGDCDNYYDCISLWNTDYAGGSYDINGEYSYEDCHNDQAYYSNDGWYIYWSDDYSLWLLNYEVNDGSAYGYCSQSSIMDCGSNWYIYNNGWSLDSTCTMSSSCSNSRSDGGTDSDSTSYVLTSNCTNDYGENVCIYNGGSLWSSDSGIATFEFNGCKDDIPFYHYKYYGTNYTVSYYLHWNTFDNDWIISDSSLEDTAGLAKCSESDLRDCTYEMWKVLGFDGDSLEYTVDKSMGYDSTCVAIVSDDDAAYCDTTNSCALWNIKLDIEDPQESTNLCDSADTIKMCVAIEASSDFSNSQNTQSVCESNYHLDIYMNVSFSSIGGYDTYENFLTDYQGIVENCIGDPTISSDLEIEIGYSTLHLCSNCETFIQDSTATDTEDEKSSCVRFHVQSVVVAMFVAAIGAAFW